jgi:hypothetical protein
MALNQEIFLERCKSKHGDRYDYTKSIYLKYYDKIIITCPIHGDFTQVAADHIAGCGCQLCKVETLRTKSTGNSFCKGKYKYTLPVFIDKANHIHDNFYSYESIKNFKSVMDKIIIICPIHGDFTQKATEHLSGYGCIQCGLDSRSQSRKRFKTLEDFTKNAKIIHGDKFSYRDVIINDTTKSTSKVRIICSIHGPFDQSLRLHLKGHGCCKCSHVCTRKTPKGENAKTKTFIYLLKLFNEYEEFYKIGITVRPITQRISEFPYKVEIIDTLETIAVNAYVWEHLILNEYKSNRYYPKISFGGETECFTKLEEYSIRNLLSKLQKGNGEHILEKVLD